MPVTWAPSMSQIADTNFVQYGQRVVVAIRALADFIAGKITADMRGNAPWEDRTGNARSGLFAVAEQASKDVTTIWLSHGHTIDYGLWLEVSNQGRYAIIMPTLQSWMPEIERLLQKLLSP